MISGARIANRRFAVTIGLGCLVVLAVAVYEWQRLNDPVRRLSGFIALPVAARTLEHVDDDCASGATWKNQKIETENNR